MLCAVMQAQGVRATSRAMGVLARGGAECASKVAGDGRMRAGSIKAPRAESEWVTRITWRKAFFKICEKRRPCFLRHQSHTDLTGPTPQCDSRTSCTASVYKELCDPAHLS